MPTLLSAALLLLLLQSGEPTIRAVVGAPSSSALASMTSSAFAAVASDPISREFYSRIRELLEQNARLTASADDGDDVRAQLPAIGAGGHDAVSMDTCW